MHDDIFDRLNDALVKEAIPGAKLLGGAFNAARRAFGGGAAKLRAAPGAAGAGIDLDTRVGLNLGGRAASGLGAMARNPVRTAVGGAGLAAAGGHLGVPGLGPDAGPTTPEGQFGYHQGQYNHLMSPITGGIEDAARQGKGEWGDDLVNRMNAGNTDLSDKTRSAWGKIKPWGAGPTDEQKFYEGIEAKMNGRSDDGSWGITRALAPWAAGPRSMDAKGHQAAALGAQTKLQGEYDTAAKAQAPATLQPKLDAMTKQMQGGNLMPAHRRALQTQIAALRAKLDAPQGTSGDAAQAIRRRMQNAGMQINEPGGAGAGAGGQGYAYQRPMGPTSVPSAATRAYNGSVSPSLLNASPYALDDKINQFALNKDGYR